MVQKHPDAVDKRQHDAQASAITELKKENARQAREISRKDKALADAATMLMLSKKPRRSGGKRKTDQCPGSLGNYFTGRIRSIGGTVAEAILRCGWDHSAYIAKLAACP